MVQHGHWGYVPPAAYELADPVRVGHQGPEVPVLGVMALGVEVGRAVRVRELLGAEGVGHKVVHTPDHEVVQKVLLKAHPLPPAVGTEYLAHGVALLSRLYGRGGAGKLAQAVVVEGTVTLLEHPPVVAYVLPLGHNLSADIVYPRHVLARKSPEVVAQGGAGAVVVVIVLDKVADVLDPMLTAPVP